MYFHYLPYHFCLIYQSEIIATQNNYKMYRKFLNSSTAQDGPNKSKFQILFHKKIPLQDFIKRTLAIGMWTRILFRLLAHLSNVYFPVTIFGHLSAYLHLSSLSTAGISWLLLLLTSPQTSVENLPKKWFHIFKICTQKVLQSWLTYGNPIPFRGRQIMPTKKARLHIFLWHSTIPGLLLIFSSCFFLSNLKEMFQDKAWLKMLKWNIFEISLVFLFSLLRLPDKHFT